MKYNCNEKVINIPDDYIQRVTAALNVSTDEAIQMYLEDEGYLLNAEANELNEKAKGNKISHKARAADGTVNKRQHKPNEEKREIIQTLFDDVISGCYDDAFIKNPEREITFRCGDNDYSITLIQHRKNKGD